MSKFLKRFETHSAYNTYITGNDKILPNVSYCRDNNDVHYNPETRVVVIFNAKSTREATTICYSSSITDFTEIEIDGVTQPSVVSSYTFSTTGEHTVKYTLADPTTIGNKDFYNCKGLTSITIPNSVTSIGQSAFAYCSSLTSITIPNSVTSLGHSVFAYCAGLTSINIPNSITTINNTTFSQCTGLTSITIPNSVTSIGTSAFYSCRSLTSITSLATTAPTVQSTTFQNINSGGTLYVPLSSTGYDVWMGTGDYYLGKSSWTKVEQ